MTNEERAALVERLLERRITADVMPWMRPDALCVEAADLIEAQAKRIEELEERYSKLGDASCARVDDLAQKLGRKEVELEAEIERREYDDIHTCHDQCQRVACVQRRRIEELEREKSFTLVGTWQGSTGSR